MNEMKMHARIGLSMIVACGLLASCGQRGALYLPEEEPQRGGHAGARSEQRRASPTHAGDCACNSSRHAVRRGS
jgi:predicted small lipoprotein YifL